MAFTIHEESVIDTLVFTETIGTNQHVMSITDNLEFFEGDENYQIDAQVRDNLIFGQTVTYTLSGSRAITQTLNFTQGAWKTEVGDVYQNFTITQTTDPGNKWPLVNQTLQFNQAVTYARGSGTKDKLTFNQVVHLAFARHRTVLQTLTMNQYATAYKNVADYIIPSSAPVTTTGTPSGISSVTIPQIVPPETPVVTFACNGKTISLRVPEFGNTDSVQQRRIQRATRGNDLIIYRDPQWSSSEDFSLDFTYIDYATTLQFQAFVAFSLGKLVTYTDFEGNEWLCILTSPELEITAPGRNNNAFNVKLEVIFS